MSTESPKRYHPVHVVLHWLIAFMVIFFLVLGSFVMSPMPNAEELFLLGPHSMLGPILGLLIVVRLGTRFFLKRPAAADAGHPALNFLSHLVHGLLYLGVFAMLLTGARLSMAYDLPAVLAGSAAMPENLFVYPQRAMHGNLSYLMLGVVGLHIGAALYHQFIRKDNLLARMWFGK